MSYVEKVIYDEVHDCYLLPLPDELLQELDWKVGDTLLWCVKNDQIYLRRFDDKAKLNPDDLLVSIIEEANHGKG